MQQQIVLLAVMSGFLFSRLAELYLHRRNFWILRSLGAQEVKPPFMAFLFRWHFLILPLALAEVYTSGGSVSRFWQLTGINLLLAGFLLKVWSIYTLGGLWTMRCLFIEGLPKKEEGPYRYLDHPEYFSRLLEGIGLCLFAGAFRVLVPYALVSFFLHHRVARVEESQLADLAAPSP